ncbi:MAG: hypothetical protein CMJ19_24655 [Phycisphaeraceae bacterium]|nr:hypothetical protein [Phycisphaeraceae bacterium]
MTHEIPNGGICMIDPKRKQELDKHKRRNLLNGFINWRWVADAKPDDVDPVELHASHPRTGRIGFDYQKHWIFKPLFHRRSAEGRMYVLWARIAATLNLLFLMVMILDFFIFTEKDGSTLDNLMHIAGPMSLVLYVVSTLVMMVCYSLARTLYEFPDGDNSQRPEYPVMQTWIIFSGMICMFVLCFRLMVWYNG